MESGDERISEKKKLGDALEGIMAREQGEGKRGRKNARADVKKIEHKLN